MPKFRKKPVVIEAVQWDGTESGALALREFMAAAEVRLLGSHVHIDTLEGVMAASPGDWIIRGVKGEFYPCKPDIFATTYEPAEEPDLQKPGEPYRPPPPGFSHMGVPPGQNCGDIGKASR